jgi:hypothetical protein
MQNHPTTALTRVPAAVLMQFCGVSHLGSRSSVLSTAAPRIAGIDMSRLKWTAHSPRKPIKSPVETVVPLRLIPGNSAEQPWATPIPRTCHQRM